MASGIFVFGVVMAILGVLLMLIAVSIFGITSTQQTGNGKSTLLSDTAVMGVTTIFAILTAIFGILFARARSSESKNMKPLMIAFIIIIVITLILYVVVIILTLSARSSATLAASAQGGLTASLILVAFGFIALTVASIVFFRVTKGKGGKGGQPAKKDGSHVPTKHKPVATKH